MRAEVRELPRPERLPKLRFLNPHVVSGRVQLTVRDGDKWAGARFGAPLEVVRTGAEALVLATARVVATALVWLPRADGGELDLSGLAPWLEHEHDPRCRDAGGLRAALDAAYGMNRWGPTLTLLFFAVDP